MKKILVAATAAVALATPALAFDVKWSGDFNHRFSYSTQADLSTLASGEGFNRTYINGYVNNSPLVISAAPTTTGTVRLPDTKKNPGDSDFFGELKYRLTLTATDDDKKVKGVFGIELGADKFGQPGAAPFDGDQTGDIEFRWGYIDFEVPFDTASHLQVGLMPVGYNKFLWSDNAAGVKWVSKRGDLGYSLAWFRDDMTSGGTGGSAKLTNDDVYAIDVTYAAKDLPKVNAFALYEEDGQQNLAGVSKVMDKKYWLGLAAEGQVGALFYGFTGIYEGGSLDANNGQTFRASNYDGTTVSTGEDSLDRNAYLLNGEITYKLDKTRIKVGYLYTSGDDDDSDDSLDNFENIDAYMGGFGSVVIFDSYADDNTFATAPYFLNLGLNMPYLAVDYDLNDKATIGASYLYINTAEGDDTDLGNEFAVRASYKIAKGMTAGIEAGYLLGGDLWDDLASDGDADDVIRTDASIRFQF